MTPQTVRVQLLYFVGCPAYRRARDRTQRVLASVGLPTDIEMTRVRTEREAAQLGFPGSPTVRVNGADIDPEGAARHAGVGLASRNYEHGGRREDIPPEALLRRALAQASPGTPR